MTAKLAAPNVILVLMHILQAATLVALSAPHLGKVPAQLDSGYVPPNYPLFIAILAAPLALGALTLAALPAWRRGNVRWLIGVYLASTVAAWTFLTVFVFASDLPVALVLLAPACLFAALIAAWRRAPRPIR
jgi:hypothetical protein